MVDVHGRQRSAFAAVLSESFHLTHSDVLQEYVRPKEGDDGALNPLAALPVGPDGPNFFDAGIDPRPLAERHAGVLHLLTEEGA